MSDVRLYMNKVNGWEKLDTAVTANGVSHLEVNLPKLRDKSQQIRGLYAQHAVHAAARQAITQEIQTLIEEGEQIFRSVREGLKEHYGKRSEKLVEFGVEPLRVGAVTRRRNRKKKSAESTAETLAPTPDPAT
jgi:uncharacterized coiled-coil DUF342 family protein